MPKMGTSLICAGISFSFSSSVTVECSDCCSKGSRCGSGHSAERGCKVTLTGKARTQSDLRDRQFCLLQHLLRALNSPLRDIVRWSHAHRLLERTRKVEVTHPHFLRHNPKGYSSFLFLSDMLVYHTNSLS